MRLDDVGVKAEKGQKYRPISLSQEQRMRLDDVGVQAEKGQKYRSISLSHKSNTR